MARTTPPLVQALLGLNYGNGTDLQQFIDSATGLVDYVVTLAAKKPVPVVLPATQQELIERWLAAYFYCFNDPLYTSDSAGKASGSYQRAPSTNDFEANDYGKGACRLDYSGMLIAIGKRNFAAGYWLGKAPSQQIPYNQRD